MPRFFIDENALQGERITVTGGDAVHIGRSLRMKPGEMITFCREGTEYISVIDRITPDAVYCTVTEKAPSRSEPELRLTIFQAFPKQDKPELIIQKCTELGAAEIVFFLSRRCVSRPEGDAAEKKLLRYKKIAEGAAKQAGRGEIPAVNGILSFEEAVKELTQKDLSLLCYENGGKPLSEISLEGIHSCGVMIGAEGGFDHEEAVSACSSGAVPVWLGKRILRCETCPIAVTAILMNMSGDLS